MFINKRNIKDREQKEKLGYLVNRKEEKCSIKILSSRSKNISGIWLALWSTLLKLIRPFFIFFLVIKLRINEESV